MPLIECSEDMLPSWSDLDFIDIIYIKEGEIRSFISTSEREMYFVGDGICKMIINRKISYAQRGHSYKIESLNSTIKVKAETDCVIIVIGGHWEGLTGSHGLFTLGISDEPKNIGDPTDYPRNTTFDNHYLDCDEYWVIYEGSGIAVSEGKRYELKPGYCLVTKMGDHHDIPEVFEEIHAVRFQSSLKGMMREGRLWVHTHGEPVPEL
jgi:mannose-6-phosphate isomerase-like protein (cupin superfamily)